MILSLRTRLTLAIVAVAGLVAAALASLLYAAVATVLWQGFARDVQATADILGQLVEWDPVDGYELEGGEALAQALSAGPNPRYVAVRTPAGPLLVDPALPELPTGAGEVEVITVGGRELRGARISVPQRTDSDAGAPDGPIEVVVLRDTASTRAALSSIAAWCWLLAASTVMLAAGAAGVVATRGTAPVRRVARALDEIGGPNDVLVVREEDVPAELRPMVRGASALLARLRDAFARERRFTADVSHELRTPLSVVRTAIDVALQSERAPEEYRRRLRAILRDIGRLSEMVERLLTLSRASAGQLALRRIHLGLSPLVEECWSPFVAIARRRGLTFVNALTPDGLADADEATLRMIVTNLLANAAEYTENGGTIRVGDGDDPAVVLEVVDSGPPLADEHLQRLFEPFWRADEARSEAGVHSGIGLTLARALARCQGLDVVVMNAGRSVVARIVRQ